MSKRGKGGRPPWRRGSGDGACLEARGQREGDGNLGGAVLTCAKASTALWRDHSHGTANGAVGHAWRGLELGHKGAVEGKWTNERERIVGKHGQVGS